MIEPREFIPAAIDYADAVAGGGISACLFARQACERFLSDLDEASHPGSQWDFRPELAIRAMLFAAQMPNIKGPEAGRAIRLMQWQLLAYANIFGFVERATGASEDDGPSPLFRHPHLKIAPASGTANSGPTPSNTEIVVVFVNAVGYVSTATMSIEVLSLS